MTYRSSCIRAVLLGLCALTLLALGGTGYAQGAAWRTGASLPQTPAASGLNFIASESPGIYELDGATLRLQVFRLSGEIELPLKLVEATAHSHVLEGKGVRVQLNTTNPESAVIEIESTDEKKGVLGVVELAVDTTTTSATVLQDFSGMSLTLNSSEFFLQSFNKLAFRNYDDNSIKFVAPLDPMKKVQIHLSTKQQEAPAAAPKQGAMLMPARGHQAPRVVVSEDCIRIKAPPLQS